ncbi:MAG TPA: hypothetical protein VFH48_46210 [Chloroflexota bacterium]|nr:hypothetical protein [Chloroflexota bacterium]
MRIVATAAALRRWVDGITNGRIQRRLMKAFSPSVPAGITRPREGGAKLLAARTERDEAAVGKQRPPPPFHQLASVGLRSGLQNRADGPGWERSEGKRERTLPLGRELVEHVRRDNQRRWRGQEREAVLEIVFDPPD